MPTECTYRASDERRLDLRKHRHLHPEGQRLISSWFHRAWQQRNDPDAVFESFIFAWFSVNAWAACITGVDRDSECIRRLQHSGDLALKFKEMLVQDTEFAQRAHDFHAYWPIFKAQRLRSSRVWANPNMSRPEVIRHYLSAGIQEFEPECWQRHRDAGEPVPLDWPHVLAAIYRVRCNLFHGEKSAHSEMDRAIVQHAFQTLVLFFRNAQIL